MLQVNPQDQLIKKADELNKYRNLENSPLMVMADSEGRIFEHPELRMMGAEGRNHRPPEKSEIIQVPHGADLFVLPGRHPVGLDPQSGQERIVRSFEGQPVFAVSAFLPPAFTSLLWAAFARKHDTPVLPLYTYSSLGWEGESFVTTAIRIDPDPRQDLDCFPADGTEDQNARLAVHDHPENRLIEHLAHCCITYRCPAARNLFMGRYEAPLPTSQGCNSVCLGCISLQKDSCMPATQERIGFVPTPEEIAQVAVPHLENVPESVVSFGQGCEGEPLTQGDLLERAIGLIREQTSSGTINLNTNGSMPHVLKRLFRVGLDSVRISLNSTREDFYNSYFMPVNYTFQDVVDSILLGTAMGRFVSINYFVFPGFTDELEEVHALEPLLRQTGIDMIQWRNLNIDPDYYMDSMNWEGTGKNMGILTLLERIRENFPDLRFGYFNPALK